MTKYNIFMYTKGTGSGHLSRINAVYRGFIEAGFDVNFSSCVYRSKYKHLLHKDIDVYDRFDFPKDIDVFICDWRSDEYTDSLSQSIAKFWVGLRRLGTIPATFPPHYQVIAIEPGVKGDALFYPIIYTYPEDIKSKEFLIKYLDLRNDNHKIALFCENGAYPKNIKKVFEYQILEKNLLVVKSSNNEISETYRDLNYYPAAELFSSVDYLVIGGGYNSVHEALCYADLSRTKILFVGGDDQKKRIQKCFNWQKKTSPESHLLARYLIDGLEKRYVHNL